jgi:hypothetical protein
MNAYCTKETCQNLCAALVRWREDFQGEDYRRERLKRWQLLGPFKRAEISLRYVTDRVVPVAEGFDLWLLDLWLFAAGELSHELLGFVVPAGLNELPLPQGRGPLVWPEIRKGARGAQTVLLLASAEALAQLVVLQFIAPDHLFRYKALLPRLLSLRAASVINIWRSDSELLAQLLLLALRQEVGDSSCWEALRGMLCGGRDDDADTDGAISFAWDHFLVPYGSIFGYLKKLRYWLRRGRQWPGDVLKEAISLGVNPNTIYLWRRQGLSDEAKKARAKALCERRGRAQRDRELADKWGTSYHAARMRIARMFKRPPCPICDKPVIAPGRKRYCSDDCFQEARRRKRQTKGEQ